MKKVIFWIIILVCALFAWAYIMLGTQQTEGWFLDFEEARGVEIEYQGQMYTLNLKQQKTLCDLLNHSARVSTPPTNNNSLPEVQSITIFLFNPENPIVLTPENSDYALFKVSTWEFEDYLQISKPKEMKQLLETTYD